jgi:hypothetical protein
MKMVQLRHLEHYSINYPEVNLSPTKVEVLHLELRNHHSKHIHNNWEVETSNLSTILYVTFSFSFTNIEYHTQLHS